MSMKRSCVCPSVRPSVCLSVPSRDRSRGAERAGDIDVSGDAARRSAANAASSVTLTADVGS